MLVGESKWTKHPGYRITRRDWDSYVVEHSYWISQGNYGMKYIATTSSYDTALDAIRKDIRKRAGRYLFGGDCSGLMSQTCMPVYKDGKKINEIWYPGYQYNPLGAKCMDAFMRRSHGGEFVQMYKGYTIECRELNHATGTVMEYRVYDDKSGEEISQDTYLEDLNEAKCWIDDYVTSYCLEIYKGFDIVKHTGEIYSVEPSRNHDTLVMDSDYNYLVKTRYRSVNDARRSIDHYWSLVEIKKQAEEAAAKILDLSEITYNIGESFKKASVIDELVNLHTKGEKTMKFNETKNEERKIITIRRDDMMDHKLFNLTDTEPGDFFRFVTDPEKKVFLRVSSPTTAKKEFDNYIYYVDMATGLLHYQGNNDKIYVYYPYGVSLTLGDFYSGLNSQEV